MELFKVTVYEYNTYSYSGIVPSEEYFFTTEEFAKSEEFEIVEYVEDKVHCKCTLEKVNVIK